MYIDKIFYLRSKQIIFNPILFRKLREHRTMQLYFQQLNYFQHISFALLQENSSRLKILKAHYLCHYTVSLQLQKIFPNILNIFLLLQGNA
jgi:hypothetical protein